MKPKKEIGRGNREWGTGVANEGVRATDRASVLLVAANRCCPSAGETTVAFGDIGRSELSGRDARSQPAEFVTKLEIALMEMGESQYWLELLAESGTVAAERLSELMGEAGQIKAMLIASINTMKSRM